MRLPVLCLALLSTATLSGCGTSAVMGGMTKPSVTAGNGPVKTAASLFIGETASQMDEEASQDYLSAQSSALESGKEAKFTNSGANGFVRVGPSKLASEYPAMECLGYSSVVWVVGTGRLVEGDACREDGGQWRAMGYVAH